MPNHKVPRRTFLKTAAAGAAGAALGLPAATRPAFAGESTLRGPDKNALKLGVASYSLRNFSREKAIEMVKALGTPYINIKSVHLPYELSPAELQAGRREFEAAGLRIVGGGTITFAEDTDAEVRKYFEYAKNAGMPLMVVTGPVEVWPRVARFAQQYDIKVAIHNHGPEDRRYPSPYDALKYIDNLDSRMGLCLDIGHTVRAGTDVAKAIHDVGPRLLDIHMKDLTDLTNRDTQVAVGEGNIPHADIFRALLDTNYQGYVNLEYEINANDPFPGMKESFAHMRGLLAGITSQRSAGASHHA